MRHLIEKFYKRSTVFTGRAVSFRVDEVILPNGKHATREYMDHPGAVAVIPFINKDTIVMVRQYRHPVGKVTLEVPAGKIDKGEKPLACVGRELEEETGYRAGKIIKLNSFWPTPAFANEVIHIYAATNLKPTKKNPDEDEFIDAVQVKFADALKMVKNGKVRDSKTVIAILLWHACFQNNK
jgi:ADP-ribose pyrophosphatase